MLDTARSQLALYRALGDEAETVRRIDQLPENEREDAAYMQFEKWLGPFLKMGLRIEVDERGNATLCHPKLPALRMAVPYEDERDKVIMLELQRRFQLETKSND